MASVHYVIFGFFLIANDSKNYYIKALTISGPIIFSRISTALINEKAKNSSHEFS